MNTFHSRSIWKSRKLWMLHKIFVLSVRQDYTLQRHPATNCELMNGKATEAPRMSRTRNKTLEKSETKPFCWSIISGCHGNCKGVSPVHVHKLDSPATCSRSPSSSSRVDYIMFSTLMCYLHSDPINVWHNLRRVSSRVAFFERTRQQHDVNLYDHVLLFIRSRFAITWSKYEKWKRTSRCLRL